MRILYNILILWPFIQQRTYADAPLIVGKVYKYCMIASSLIILVFEGRKIGRVKQQKHLIWFLLFTGTYLFSTLLFMRGSMFYVSYHMFGYMAVAMFISIKLDENADELMTALSFIYGAFIFLNFITDIMYPQGLYKARTSGYHAAHLLGDDNALIYVILPGIICMVCSSLKKYQRIRWYVWLAMIVSEYTLIKIWSASAMVCLFLTIVMIIYMIHLGRFNPKLLLVGTVLAILGAFLATSSPFIKKFVEDILHKDITFHGRASLWAQAYDMFRNNPVLGTGGYYQNGSFLINQYSTTHYPSHTPFLQIMIDGGAIALAFFVIITVKGYINTARNKGNFGACVLAIGMTCMLINYITEHAEFHHFVIIAVLMLKVEAIGMPDQYKRKRFFKKKYKSLDMELLNRSRGLNDDRQAGTPS